MTNSVIDKQIEIRTKYEINTCFPSARTMEYGESLGIGVACI